MSVSLSKPSIAIQSLANQCQHWLQNKALPLWAEKGYQPITGLFEETLNCQGTVNPQIAIRFRVQPRQLYVFAHATVLGWIDGKTIVNQSFTQGFNYFKDQQNRFIFSIDPQRKIPNDLSVYTYEYAFALLGHAWHYQLFPHYQNENGQNSAQLANELYLWIEQHFQDNINGGLYSGLPYGDLRCQNPHMHLFEALMVCYEIIKDPIWLARATQYYEIFSHTFLEQYLLREFFDLNLKPQHIRSENIDPGHHYEWIWLLSHYRKLTTDPLVTTKIDQQIIILNQFATQYGHSELGLVYDEIKDNGKPYRTTSRLWNQTEYLKASVALYEQQPNLIYEQQIVKAVDHIFKYYLDPAPIKGLWLDQLDHLGQPMSTDAPASTLYHLFLAFSELYRISRKP